MDLENEMGSLEIHEHKENHSRKRRLSGCTIRSKMKKLDENVQLQPMQENMKIEPLEVFKSADEEDDEEEKNGNLRRSGRKRQTPKLFTDTFVKEPMKALTLEKDYEEIKKIYLDKTFKRSNPSLETIFEVPKEKQYMSGRKLRRMIAFDDARSASNKTRKRMMKAKKVSSFLSKKSLAMSVLMKKLADIEGAGGGDNT